ncbi:Protein PLANT CADMIUM RESISTANCE 2 [Diplonema papillatum]|nr:Protein PLANT CADMIUM RESISTANCE 2 [Diplonema papillatum]
MGASDIPAPENWGGSRASGSSHAGPNAGRNAACASEWDNLCLNPSETEHDAALQRDVSAPLQPLFVGRSDSDPPRRPPIEAQNQRTLTASDLPVSIDRTVVPNPAPSTVQACNTPSGPAGPLNDVNNNNSNQAPLPSAPYPYANYPPPSLFPEPPGLQAGAMYPYVPVYGSVPGYYDARFAPGPVQTMPIQDGGYPSGQPKQWDWGFCECFSDSGVCCDVFWCEPCQLGRVHSTLIDRNPGEMNPWVCGAVVGCRFSTFAFVYLNYALFWLPSALVAALNVLYRVRTRGTYSIMSDHCFDCLAATFCGMCSLAQVHNELAVHGSNPGYTCCQPSRKPVVNSNVINVIPAFQQPAQQGYAMPAGATLRPRNQA